MKKISIAVQWMVLIALVGFSLYAFFRPAPKPAYTPETWNSWDGFLAVSFAGIGRRDEPQYPSPKRLADQLSALKHAGFNTITPADALQFVRGKSPLPKQALLLMFEGGRKDVFIRATPLLQKNGQVAALGVPTAMTEKFGNFYLKKMELRKILKLPTWSLFSMGHEAVFEVPVDANGAKGHFLTRRIWDDGEQESGDAFAERVANDYSRSEQILQSVSKKPVDVYLYAFADNGTSAGADPAAAKLNREALAAHYQAAVTRAGDPFNGPDSSPYDLTRLRASGTWSGEELIAELDKFLPHEEPVRGLATPELWLLVQDAFLSSDVLTIPEGSSAWLRGSGLWSDVDVNTVLSRSGGSVVSVYVRYAGAHSYLRVVLNSEGVRVQERIGGQMQTLNWHPVKFAENTALKIRVKAKGNRAWVWLNDELTAGPLPLSASTAQGRVGLGSEAGRAEITAFEAVPLSSVYAVADRLADIPESEQGLVRAILPHWFDVARQPAISEAQRGEILATAAQGVETIPMIDLPENADADAVSRFVADLSDILKDPVLRSMLTQVCLSESNGELADALHSLGLTVIHRVTPDRAIDLAGQRSFIERDDKLFIDATSGVEATVSRLLHTCPPRRLLVWKDAGVNEPAGLVQTVHFEPSVKEN